jgi:O-antigen ligase
MANAYKTKSNSFWMLSIILVALFMFGGSSRGDVQSLVILNPILILGCGFAFLGIKYEQFQNHKYVIGLCTLIVALVILYIILQRYIIFFDADMAGITHYIQDITQLNDIGHRIPLAPADISSSLTFLLVPLSVILLSVQLPRNDLMSTIPVIIMVGAISGLFGILQLIGSVHGQLYPYQITNYGSAVGAFANRNHAAVFLATLFPVLAFFSSRAESSNAQNVSVRRFIAGSIAIMLVPLILITGSRSGLLAATLGLGSAFFIYTKRSHDSDRLSVVKSATAIALIVLASLVLISVYFARAEAIDRFFYESAMDNNRKDFWQAAVRQFWSFYPFGFGPGSFAAVYQVDEPKFLLGAPYLNRLHNDWLETALTFGIFGILFMLIVAVWYFYRAFKLWVHMDGSRSTVLLGRMASAVIALFALASFSDYPLRTPALAGFATLALVWFAYARDNVVAADS